MPHPPRSGRLLLLALVSCAGPATPGTAAGRTDAPATRPAAAAPASPAAATPGSDVRDPVGFAACVDVGSARLVKLAGGMGFTEGPVWVPGPAGATVPAGGPPAGGEGDGGHLIFSDLGDVNGGALMRWSAAGGVSPFRRPSDYTNGNARDARGRLLHCCHARRQVLRTEPDGSVVVLAGAYDGKPLNSPNDLVVRPSDGTVFFTDPPYGLPKGAKSDLGFNGVYRLAPAGGPPVLVTKDEPAPNGIALSPDERTLYVANSDRKAPVIRAFPLAADGSIGPGKDLCRIDKGVPDGLKVDADGRLWSSAGDGVQVFAADGTLLGKILVPESPANLAFGGPDGGTLFVTAKTSLYAIPVKVGWAGAGKTR